MRRHCVLVAVQVKEIYHMKTLGYVVIEGRKILVTVWDGERNMFVTKRAGGQDGPRLDAVEEALKEIKDAWEKLLNGRAQPI